MIFLKMPAITLTTKGSVPHQNTTKKCFLYSRNSSKLILIIKSNSNIHAKHSHSNPLTELLNPNSLKLILVFISKLKTQIILASHSYSNSLMKSKKKKIGFTTFKVGVYLMIFWRFKNVSQCFFIFKNVFFLFHLP